MRYGESVVTVRDDAPLVDASVDGSEAVLVDENEDRLKKYFIDTFGAVFNQCLNEMVAKRLKGIRKRKERQAETKRLKGLKPFNINNIMIDGSKTAREILDSHKNSRMDPATLGGTVDTARSAVIIPNEKFTDPANWLPFRNFEGGLLDGNTILTVIVAHETANLAAAHLFNGDFYALRDPDAVDPDSGAQLRVSTRSLSSLRRVDISHDI